MATSVERFEDELRFKISHKSSSFQSEEGFLIKQFKFFDIYNTGILSFDNYYRTVEKIGIIRDKEEVRELFPLMVGITADGEINYREYSKSLYSVKAPPQPQKDVGFAYSPNKSVVLDEDDDDPANYKVLRTGMNSQDYPLATTTSHYKPTNTAARRSLMNREFVNQEVLQTSAKVLNEPNYDAHQDTNTLNPILPDPPVIKNYDYKTQHFEVNQFATKTAPKNQLIYINRFKEELNRRGGRGLVGLLKQFKLFDTDQSGCLDKYEFKKAIDDYEIDVHPKDLENLFNSFDTDANGKIEYNEFFQLVTGVMNEYRQQIVDRVYAKLDKDKEGAIDLNEIIACFDPYRHPDIDTGKNDPEGVFNDFKDSLEVYHNVVHNYNSSAKVSRQEFSDFYTFISAQIENDAHFDMMMNGVWNMDNKNNYEEMPYAGSQAKITNVNATSEWLNDHHRKMFGGEDDFYHKGENTYTTAHQAEFRTDIPAPKVTAGIPTWPIGASTNWQGGLMHEDQRANF